MMDVEAKLEAEEYYFSVAFVRILLVCCLIFGMYGFPPVLTDVLQPLFNFAQGTLFMLYGYFVLRDGKDLGPHIKRTAKAFGVLLLVFLVLNVAYMQVVEHNAWGFLTPKMLFNFVVLNYWEPRLGSYMWYVQSTLYALVICQVLKPVLKHDGLVCALLFVLGIAVGEGAGLLQFNVQGYTFISGNFLTRTLPYMLLGRLLYKHEEGLWQQSLGTLLALFGGGVVLCFAELRVLELLEKLVYAGHLVGFIPMAVATTCMALRMPFLGADVVGLNPDYYKRVFFLFNPVGEGLLLLSPLWVKTMYQAMELRMWLGLLVCMLCLLLPWLYDFVVGVRHEARQEGWGLTWQRRKEELLGPEWDQIAHQGAGGGGLRREITWDFWRWLWDMIRGR